jgi:sodium/bile acid cotransporter 7
MKRLKKYIPDWFISGLTVMIIAAWLQPGVGMATQPFNLGLIIDIGIVLIFFFYGLKLDTTKVLRGMSNWRMHLSIQATTFLLFPLLVIPFYPVFKNTTMEIYWIGMLFLAALPSTVSSSVVMVSIAGGNIPGAIFNASISGIIGILMTPLWMGIFMEANVGGFNLPEVITQLVLRIIVPVAAGMFFHRILKTLINRHMKKMAAFDKIIILLIVYESFSQTFMAGMFSSVSWIILSGLLATIIALFFIVLTFTGIMANLMKFPVEDKITLQFAGSKKSLVHGSVFASVMFTGISGAGIFLIPVMIYHTFQLFYISVLARRIATSFNPPPLSRTN